MRITPSLLCMAMPLLLAAARAAPTTQQTYENRLKPIADAKPLRQREPSHTECRQ